ncbi:MAG: hypothetical protein ACI9SC_000251 [Gammaproteobacteria bacterium]|jgi:hypothetical protein
MILVLSLQSLDKYLNKFDAPSPYRVIADRNAAAFLGIFNIAMAEIDSKVEPNGLTNYAG